MENRGVRHFGFRGHIMQNLLKLLNAFCGVGYLESLGVQNM